MANSIAQDTDLDLLAVSVGGSTVEITPTVTAGTKIADYVIDDVSGELFTPEQTEYSAGPGIDITGYVISATGDITPYSGGTGIDINNHNISVIGDITPYSAGTGIDINNHNISVVGDITPYSAGDYVDITGHVISVATPRKLVTDSSIYKTVDTAANEVHIGVNGDITPYSAGSGIDISGHVISVSSGVSVSLYEAQYGVSTYSDITAAIASNKIVYCRVSPSQSTSRMAFLAYIGSNNVEFQYYRSVTGHTSAQQGDQVFVYTVSSNNNWTTTTREAYTKIAVGSGLGSAYSNGTLTISSNGSANYATSAGSADYAASAGTAASAGIANSALSAGSAEKAASATSALSAGTATSALSAGSAAKAASATKANTWTNTRTLAATGDVTWSISTNGSANVSGGASIVKVPSTAITGVPWSAMSSHAAAANHTHDISALEGTATYFSGTSALYAINTDSAASAGTANSALSAGSAAKAASATSALSAGTATSALSAGTANSALSAGSAAKVEVIQTTVDQWLNIPLYSAGNQKFYLDNDYQIRYNPNKNTLSANTFTASIVNAATFSGNLSGIAAKAESATSALSAGSATSAASAYSALSAATTTSALSAGSASKAASATSALSAGTATISHSAGSATCSKNGFFYEGIPGGPTATFNSASTYAVGDFAVTGNTAFSASTAVSTPGAWSSVSSKFTRLSQVVWTVTDPAITGLYNGLQIGIKIPSYGGNSGSNATMLNVNGLGNKQIRINDANYTTQYGSGTVATLTYDGSAFQIGDRDMNNYVSQYRTTADAGYFPLLFKKTANSTSETHSARFDERTKYQPSTQTLTVPNVVVSSISADSIIGPISYATSAGSSTSSTSSYYASSATSAYTLTNTAIKVSSATSADYATKAGSVSIPKHSNFVTPGNSVTVSYTNNNTDPFDIIIEKESGNNITNVKIKANNISRSPFTVFVNKDEKYSVGTTAVTIKSVDFATTIFTVDVVCAGIGFDLPRYTLTICIQSNSVRGQYTIYDDYLYYS